MNEGIFSLRSYIQTNGTGLAGLARGYAERNSTHTSIKLRTQIPPPISQRSIPIPSPPLHNNRRATSILCCCCRGKPRERFVPDGFDLIRVACVFKNECRFINTARISMKFRRDRPHRADTAEHRLRGGSTQTMPSSICDF